MEPIEVHNIVNNLKENYDRVIYNKEDRIKTLEEANKDLKENRQKLLQEIEELKKLHKIAFEKAKEYKAIVDSTVVDMVLPKNRLGNNRNSSIVWDLSKRFPNK